jgi:actin-related protein 6
MVQAEPPVKKRKRTTTTVKIKTEPTTMSSLPTTAPTRILVIDNGGDSIKFGWMTGKEPRTMPNLTARLPQQWTILAGDLVQEVQNPTQLLHPTRSMERSFPVNLGNQIQVWKRVLDVLHVAIPLATAQVFGWKKNPEAVLAPQQCAVLVTVPPFCPRVLLDQITTIWMEDFQFAHVGFVTASLCAVQPHSTYQTCCVVDLGWSQTTVVPTFQQQIIQESALRRMAIGGRQLQQIWKYQASYRQWNLMDQDFLLQQIFEETAFLSLQFNHDMKIAQTIPPGRRPYDREFVLPDYQTTFKGHVQLPPFLRREAELKAMGKVSEDNDDDSEEDDDFNEQDAEEEDEDFDANLEDGNDSPDDDEEETLEQIKERLLVQRQEEERRRREAEAQQQILNVSVECFAIPETLFRPSDAGLPAEWANLPETIHQSIEACPVLYRAALYRSIRLVGGLSQLPNLKERLEQELRCLVGCRYEIEIETSETATIDAWLGAKQLSIETPFENWSFSRMEWEQSFKKGAWARLLSSSGGRLV